MLRSLMVLGLRAILVAAIPSGALPGQEPLPTWRLDGPDLTTAQSGVELHRVRAAASLPDAGIAIADHGNLRVLILSPTGDIRRAIGREGTGPGDFQSIFDLAVHGDTIVAYDAVSLRVSLFHISGARLGTVALSRVSGRVAELRGIMAGDSYVVTTRGKFAVEQETGLRRDTVPVLLLDGRSGGTRPLHRLEWRRSFVHVMRSGTVTASSGYPAAFLGETVLTASAGRVIVVPLGTSRVEIIRRDASRATALTLPLPTREVDRAMVSAYRDSLLVGARRDIQRFPNGPIQISASFGEAFPVPQDGAVIRVARTVGSEVWLQAFPASRDTTAVWYVVDAVRERLVGRLVLPRRWEVLGGDTRRVLVLQRDELDVETVARYDIRR